MGRPERRLLAAACIVVATVRLAPASAQERPPEELPPEEAVSIPEPPACHSPDESWLDRKHENLHRFLWRSARSVDGWFGAQLPEQMYAANTRGSITPILLWDEYNGLSPKFRFRVKIPFPHLDERYNAFVGTFSRDEFVTEREQASGAIPRQRSGGEIDRDQTLVGVQFRGRRDDGRREGGRFEADAGLRIRSPIDPFVKGGYRFDRGIGETMFLTWRETAFWQNSEGFGVTSRIDFDRTFDERSLLRWTASATISQESEGVRGYSALTMYRGVGQNQAVAAQLFTNGEFDADVPLGEYGMRFAYRRRILHDWLVLELRPSLTWPKEERDEPRSASWGFGIGLEMFFGEDEFQSRPATF